MEGKLIKNSDGFSLCIPNGKTNYFIASTDGMYVDYKLSLKNCQEIECGYDLDELALEGVKNFIEDRIDRPIARMNFKKGFQKALEILGDKKSVVKEFLDTWFDVDDTLIGDPVWVDSQGLQVITPKQLNNLYQQTEWAVEIVMEDNDKIELSYGATSIEDSGYILRTQYIKLDADGWLILKLKSE